MSDELDVQRGRQAQEVLDNEVFAEANTLIEQEIIRLWRESKDAGDREKLHMLLGLQAKLRTALEAVMRSGEVASAEILRKRSRLERLSDVIRS